jgi:hypothetical protein
LALNGVSDSEIAMMKGFLATATLAATVATAAQSAVAQNGPWCLVNVQKGSKSCPFVSREQCLLSTGGNVRHCVANPALRSIPERLRKPRQPNG